MTTSELFLSIKQLNVLVIGDVMLDIYQYGQVKRISPEAPVPIVDFKNEESRIGGAANVALNCQRLGAKVKIASIIGDDANGRLLKAQLEKEHIDTSLVYTSPNRPTTTKTRVISRGVQLLRIDQEDASEINDSSIHQFLDGVLKYIQMYEPDVVIFEDYDKGLFSSNVIQRILKHCEIANCITAVDPKKRHFFEYKNCTLFKPNLAEVAAALSDQEVSNSQADLDELSITLQEKLHAEILLITLSEKGVYYTANNQSSIIPAHKRNIADVSGAGDTVISVAALVYAVTKDVQVMASYANIAGGLVCESVGVVPVDLELLINEINKI